MTISEQIREAALYDGDDGDPVVDMSNAAYSACCQYKKWPEQLSWLSDTDLRTFILLVAEALE